MTNSWARGRARRAQWLEPGWEWGWQRGVGRRHEIKRGDREGSHLGSGALVSVGTSSPVNRRWLELPGGRKKLQDSKEILPWVREAGSRLRGGCGDLVGDELRERVAWTRVAWSPGRAATGWRQAEGLGCGLKVGPQEGLVSWMPQVDAGGAGEGRWGKLGWRRWKKGDPGQLIFDRCHPGMERQQTGSPFHGTQASQARQDGRLPRSETGISLREGPPLLDPMTQWYS